MKASYPEDVARLRELAPRVEKLLEDDRDQVRQEAVTVLACLTSTMDRTGITLSSPTMARLLERYPLESSSSVRAEINKLFAIATNDTPEIRKHLLARLRSVHDFERNPAERALRRFYPVARFDELPVCVSAADPHVRHGCAIALSFYPVEARKHLPALEKQLAAETDPYARRQLELTVDLIKRWPRELNR